MYNNNTSKRVGTGILIFVRIIIYVAVIIKCSNKIFRKNKKGTFRFVYNNKIQQIDYYSFSLENMIETIFAVLM